MAGNVLIAINAAAAITATVAVVSLSEPLTSGGGTPVAAQSDTLPEALVGDGGYQYCVDNLPSIDCNCFRNIVGHAMANQSTRAFGWAYGDTWTLAASQAKRSC